MNYRRHRKAIEKLYTDSATIYRYANEKDPNTKVTSKVPQAVYTDQPCRMSQNALATNDQTEAQNQIRYETKLFIAPELELQQGDMLQVTRGTLTRKYETGEPFLYPTHQEVSIQRKEWA